MDNLVLPSDAMLEVDSLAALMAQAHRDRIRFFQKEMGLSLEEANAKVSASPTPDQVARTVATPAEELSWFDLSRLMAADPDQGLRKWEAIKQAARDELLSGHRAARTVDWDSSPWQRAQFSVLRESFMAEWQPRNGIESTLVDTLAQTYTAFCYWLERLNQLTTNEAKAVARGLEQDGNWTPPRVPVAEAIEQAAAMVDRFNRLFLRTLRALRDLRRYSPTVMIASAGQVNIASGPQANAAQIETPCPHLVD